MMDKKAHLKKLFNKASHSYDEQCQPQQYIGSKLLRLLMLSSPSSQRIMDLGCGTGLVTAELARTFTYQDFHAIDISNESLCLAAKRLHCLGIKTYEADFDRLSAYGTPFDIIFSNMALHWSTCFISTLSRLSTLLSPHGTLAFSIPLPGTFHELQNAYSRYYFFDQTFIATLLTHCGYDVLIQERETMIYKFSDTVSALRSIKQTGASYASDRRHRSLLGKSFIQPTKVTQLTYVAGFFIAVKRDIHVNQIIRRRNRYRCRKNLY
ncbi:methyltransferase domain-containing protein [Aquicella lusitana]|uniref:Malonyl-ACP O-methyltransferase BioC n=1 Tax=Aquicella lusitana TaxID=254246 RepID=A0A370GGQ3_9COXI|nr:methyltransferase domain-containing protein [Aquicella lusitana]RDI42426.1 malonyl-ACP O-methyltransferase BioC [Aquicella lusitana]VVC74112.1 Malonyl-[acyl-carrier protein] O-methyltransferase [Aquicella lusitana]